MANNLNPNIFLSYCWANTDVADEIDNTFKSIGIQFKRDVRDATYRTSIKEFMQQIGKTDFVLMIVSDEYLQSENCMYEVTELLNTHEFEKRVLPIVIDNATQIFKVLNQATYYEYWEKEVKEAEKLKRKHVNESTVEYAKKCQNIKNYLPVFFQKITDLNVSSYEKLRKENYRELLNIIGFDEIGLIEEVIAIAKIEDLELQEIEVDRFLERHPNNKYGIFQKSWIADKQGYQLKKRKFLEEAIKIDRSFALAHNNLGNVLSKKFAEYELAKYHYNEAIKIDPMFETAHYNLALLLNKRFSDKEGAKFHYQEAIKISPNYADAHSNFGFLLQDYLKDYEGARKHYEIAIKIDPHHSIAHNNLGVLLEYISKDYETAKFHYEHAIENVPTFELAKENLKRLIEKHFTN